jgi:transposase-like protein
LQVGNPVCPICARAMIILRIEPDEPNHQRRTYECPECRLVEYLTVKQR